MRVRLLIAGVLVLGGQALARPDPPVKLRDNEWFTQEVVVVGTRIRISVNDVVRTRYEADEPPRPGHLGIALSGEATLRIRKIEVQELPAPNPRP